MEMVKNCLCSLDFVMEIWKRIITVLISVHPRVVYTWGPILWTVVQDKPLVYEQEDVVEALVMLQIYKP